MSANGNWYFLKRMAESRCKMKTIYAIIDDIRHDAVMVRDSASCPHRSIARAIVEKLHRLVEKLEKVEGAK